MSIQPRVISKVFNEQPLLNFEQDGQKYSIGCRTNKNFVLNTDINFGGSLDIVSIDSTLDGHGINITGSIDSSINVANNNKSLTIGTSGGGAVQQTILKSGGTGTNALHINASSGGIDIDSNKGIDIDAVSSIALDSTTAGLSLDGVTNSNFTVTGSGQNLTLSSLGGGTQKTILNSAGTGTNALT